MYELTFADKMIITAVVIIVAIYWYFWDDAS